MRARQVRVKRGHYRVVVGQRSIDVAQVGRTWYVNQFPDPPIDCGESQSVAVFWAVNILRAAEGDLV